MGINLQHSISHYETKGVERLQINLEGRFMILKSHEEYPCQSLEISPEEVSLRAPIAAMPGERVALYLSELGRLPGVVLRQTETGFEMGLHLTPKKREELARQLIISKADRSMRRGRRGRYDRILPLLALTVLRPPRGEAFVARIKSLSPSDVAIETDHPIALGAELTIGNTPAKVVRLLDNGFACEFIRHFRPGEIDETTRL